MVTVVAFFKVDMRVAEFCTQKADGFTESEDASGMLQQFEKLRGILFFEKLNHCHLAPDDEYFIHRRSRADQVTRFGQDDIIITTSL